jgi:hypothetical protein
MSNQSPNADFDFIRGRLVAIELLLSQVMAIMLAGNENKDKVVESLIEVLRSREHRFNNPEEFKEAMSTYGRLTSAALVTAEELQKVTNERLGKPGEN